MQVEMEVAGLGEDKANTGRNGDRDLVQLGENAGRDQTRLRLELGETRSRSGFLLRLSR